ncbi:MAG: hypothetical protein WD876_00235 [Candidatus Pacearchaeota archaeon]
MPNQTPRSLEVITVIDFKDEKNHYLQSWKGQLYFKDGEIINLRGNLGISECRTGRYQVSSDEPANQLILEKDNLDVFHKFYVATRLD